MLNETGQSKITEEDKHSSNGTDLSKEWTQLKDGFSKVDSKAVYNKKNVLLCSDSRVALSEFPKNSVSCIITSPPYGNLKNYGSENQIGFGQNLKDEYLPDLESIFSELHRISKHGAAMWVVLDMIKENGEMIPLPWEVITRAQSAGWTFHDLVVWDKGKSLPWSSQGKFRGVCEYILLLGKGKLNKFNLDAVRDSENLSPYWVKYPERYHPDGKAPTDLWHFPIPTQGSWAKNQSRHFCPLPIGLIAKMLAISTNSDDVVLDPFAGTASVSTVASYLDRFGVGIEINREFVDEFKDFGYDAITEKAKVELPNKSATNNTLRETIIKLRMQKYPKTLFSGISRIDQLGTKAREYVEAFFIKSSSITEVSEENSLNSSDLGKIELQILLKKDADFDLVSKSVDERVNTAPLSIFGIKAGIEIIKYKVWSKKSFFSFSNNREWYLYKNGHFHNHSDKLSCNKLRELFNIENKSKMPNIISCIDLSVEPPIKV